MLNKVCLLITLLPTVLLLSMGWYAYDQSKRVVTLVAEEAPGYLVLPTLNEMNAYVSGNHPELLKLFEAWVARHKKVYASPSERSARLGNFAASLDRVQKHNARTDVTYRLGLTAFADMTDEEFSGHFNLKAVQKSMQQECSATTTTTTKVANPPRPKWTAKLKDLTPPKSIDWRDYNIITPVKNQGHCGSCYAFSTTGALEAHYKKNRGKWVSLSEQQILDCAQAFDNHGCNGGLPSHVFEYIRYNGGIDAERAYPYTATETGSCQFRKRGVAASVIDSVNITQFDEKELEVAVGLIGPVSVAFQVVSDFRLYTSGVYSSPNCKKDPGSVNHAVLAVAMGTTEDGIPFWGIKNSWGEQWGEGGYFKLKRGTNECGVSDCASFPVV